MVGKDFLESANLLQSIPTEANWRSSIGRAFLAYLHELLAALARWGFPKPVGVDPLLFVQSCLARTQVMDATRLEVGAADLLKRTQEADFDLSSSPQFQDKYYSTDTYFLASTLIALIQQIEADPARLAAVIAAIQTVRP